MASQNPRAAPAIPTIDIQELFDCGMWKTSDTSAVKRTVSGAFISPPSSSASSSGSTSSKPVSASFRSSNSDDIVFDIVTNAESQEALEHIGFNQSTAATIWQRFQNKPADDLGDLWSFIKAHIEDCDAWEEKQFRTAMDDMGLVQSFQDAILDPQHRQVFLTQSLRFWVLDTLEVRLLEISDITDRAQGFARRSRRIKNLPPRPHVQDIWGNSQAGSSKAATKTPTVGFANFQPGAMRPETTMDDYYLPETLVDVCAAEPPTKPGHFKLYKAISGGRMKNWLRPDGQVVLKNMETMPGGDFNYPTVAFYWTREKATAEKYRVWAARRFTTSTTWIICIQVPETWYSAKVTRVLNYSNPWKRVVWACRKHEDLDAQDQHFMDQEILSGHICQFPSSHRDLVDLVDSASAMSHITPNWLLLINNNSTRSTQHVVMKRSVMAELFRLAKGSIYIDVAPAVTANLNNQKPRPQGGSSGSGSQGYGGQRGSR